MTEAQLELVEAMIRMTGTVDRLHRMTWTTNVDGPGLLARFPKEGTVPGTEIVFLVNDLRLSVGRRLAPGMHNPMWVLLDIRASDGTGEAHLLARLRDAVVQQGGGRSLEDLVKQTTRAIRGE